MKNSRLTSSAAGVVTVAGVLLTVFVLRGGFPPGIDRTPHEAAGLGLAKEVIGLAKSGGQVILITRDTSDFQSPAFDILTATLKKELHKSGVSIRAIHALQVDPLRPLEVPPGDFAELIRSAPPETVIVSLMGPPTGTPLRPQPGRPRPAIVAFCPGGISERVDLRRLIEDDTVQVVIVNRRSKLSGSLPHTARDYFTQNFAVVTRATLDELAVGPETHNQSQAP
jgi:hypothetical protein